MTDGQRLLMASAGCLLAYFAGGVSAVSSYKYGPPEWMKTETAYWSTYLIMILASILTLKSWMRP